MDILLEAAYVEVEDSEVHPEDREALRAASALRPEDPTMEGSRKVELPAFSHEIRWEKRGRSIGFVALRPSAYKQITFGDQGFQAWIAPKYQPMLAEPRPWRPSGHKDEGGFLMHRVQFVRTSRQKMTGLRFYSPRRVVKTMDAVGATPWRVNGRVFDLMVEAQRRDLSIAELPEKDDPVIPELPSKEEAESMDPLELARLKLKVHNATKRVQELQSARPTFELKLAVARDFRHAPRLYFPHNVDFRGRAYPIPPHLNHISDDTCRGLLEFAEPKPLGKDGFYWLKVSLANLLGKNKISYDERVALVDASREQIMAVARDPLAEESLEFWAEADDGPWQALARCLEIAEVWSTGDEEGFLSGLPVHLDGSCNGLQHYAALGRDEDGGKAVNLYPAEKPQDVYTVVLEIVKDKVNEAAEAEVDEEDTAKADAKRMAKRLLELGVLQRKVVKQTIMTICYGVTTIGARQQVLKQLEDMAGDTVSVEELRLLAGHLSKLVLKSIDQVFERAMRIKKWFDLASRDMNKMDAPTCWLSPIGLACAQPYKELEKVHVITRRQKVTLEGDEKQNKVHKVKQRMGFPPNFIHSLDASHMMMVAEGCQREGIYFAGVHDSFWTHACDAPKLHRIARSSFVELHQRSVLEDLRTDLQLHLGGAATLPELPEQGGLDLEQVRDSPYFFG